MFRNVSIEANATFAHSKVVRNSRDPLMGGKFWLRVRIHAVASTDVDDLLALCRALAERLREKPSSDGLDL